jgi:hypothetical protein
LEREDEEFGFGARASYRVSENFTLTAGAGFDKRNSTFFVPEYESRDLSLALSGRILF